MRPTLMRLGGAVLLLATLAPQAPAQRCPFQMNTQFMFQQRMMQQRMMQQRMMMPRFPQVFRPPVRPPMFVNRMIPQAPLRFSTFRPQVSLQRTMVPRMNFGIQRVTQTFRMPQIRRPVLPPARPMIARGGGIRPVRPQPAFAARWNPRIHRTTSTRVTMRLQQTPRWQATARMQERRHVVQRPPVVVRRPVAPARPVAQRRLPPVNPRPTPTAAPRTMTQVTARVSFQCGSCHSCPRGRPALPALGLTRTPLVMAPRPVMPLSRPALPVAPMVRQPVLQAPPAIFRPGILPPGPALVLNQPPGPMLLPSSPLRPATLSSAPPSLALTRSPFDRPGEIVKERPVAPITVTKSLPAPPGSPVVVAALAPPPLPARPGQMRSLRGGLSQLEAIPVAAPLRKAELAPVPVVHLDPGTLLGPPLLPSGATIKMEEEEQVEKQAVVVEEPALVETLALAPPLPRRETPLGIQR